MRSIFVGSFRSVIEASWADFSNYQVTVTDRYHGVIFSLISGTPVVVLESTDHKLRSGVQWFPPQIFGNMIRFAGSVEEAVQAAEHFYSADSPVPCRPTSKMSTFRLWQINSSAVWRWNPDREVRS
ncbi:polysaccharide pyruvyl transferase family protein [Aeromicrobium sp. UC242_57]|uniref:polysaccharide pyruvyl transferase family protein n=1 Tax=Aeromicrobium sp. UC242_57 TaxID=3374624 RepID=UPI0037B5239C